MRSLWVVLAVTAVATAVTPVRGETLDCLINSLGNPYCAGDCDRNGTVGISEVIRGVGIALGQAALEQCAPADLDDDRRVTVAELTRAVAVAESGCSLPAPLYDDPIRLRLGRSGGERSLNLSLTTEDEFSCLGFRIDTALRNRDGTIVAVLGCVLPPLGPCLQAFGPAHYSVDLELDPGTYRLELRERSATDVFDIHVTDDGVETSIIAATFTTLE